MSAMDTCIGYGAWEDGIGGGAQMAPKFLVTLTVEEVPGTYDHIARARLTSSAPGDGVLPDMADYTVEDYPLRLYAYGQQQQAFYVRDQDVPILEALLPGVVQNRDRLRQALEQIANYDWDYYDRPPIEDLQALARAALEAE